MLTWWEKRPTFLAFFVLSALIVSMAIGAAMTGFGGAYVPNFLLNAACDMLGGLTVLFLIDPIIRRAATGIRAHRRMNTARFCYEVSDAREHVRILDTSSELIRRDSSRGDVLLAAIRGAVEGGAQVRILLMSPSSDASRARQNQLKGRNPELDLDRAINQTITQVRRMSRELGDLGSRIELRLYSTPAPFILYSADSTLFYSIVPNMVVSDESPHVEVRAQSDLGRHVIQSFEEFWLDAREPDALLRVRFADQPGAVPMLLRHIEIADDAFVTSSRIDRVFGYQEDPRFLIGEDSGTVYAAVPVEMGTDLHECLLAALADRYPRASRHRERTFFHMVKVSESNRPDGRVLAYKGLPAVQLANLLTVATREIRILDTSSTLLVEDGEPAEDGLVFKAALEALEHGASVKVLLMYPGTSYTRLRAEEISRPHVESEIEQNLRWLTKLRDEALRLELPQDRVQVRLYNAPPSFSVYQVDDSVIVGFMPVGTRSSGATHYSTELESPLAGFVLDQFDLLWSQGPGDHVHQIESLQYLTIDAPQQRIRILARTWQAGGEWFVCSARVDDLLHQHGEDLPIVFDQWPNHRWWLPKVLGKVELNQAIDTYVRRFGVNLRDATIRQVVPLR